MRKRLKKVVCIYINLFPTDYYADLDFTTVTSVASWFVFNSIKILKNIFPGKTAQAVWHTASVKISSLFLLEAPLIFLSDQIIFPKQ